MKQVTHFTEMPESIRFESFPGKAARVWLRKNVAGEPVAAEDGAEYTAYKADEVYFETTATEDEVKAAFDDWYAFGESWTEEDGKEPSLADRVTNAENAILALMGI